MPERDPKGLAIYVGLAAALVALFVGVVAFWNSDDDTSTEDPMGGPAARLAVWGLGEQFRTGAIDGASATVQQGGVKLSAPQPTGSSVEWSLEDTPGGHALIGKGKVVGEDIELAWRFGQGNPHTLFEGEFTAPLSQLPKPVSGMIELPDGEVSYVNEQLEIVPFAGKPVLLSALTPGVIRWRNGADAIALWQWNADRVELTEAEGRVRVIFHWFHPDHHSFPEGCAAELGDLKMTIKPRLKVSFTEVPFVATGRFGSGVTSAVIPIFFDPANVDDPRVSDGASTSASDFAARATTIALGHSAPNDARYGNGGLVGLEVGGTMVVPTAYKDDEALGTFREAIAPTSVDVAAESELRPADCEAWKEALAEQAPRLGPPIEFDGKFPNLLGAEQHHAAPGLGSLAPIWRPTRLTGRRKDVVTQALSRTYLERLAERRGLAVLEIPIVATRNPLIAAASESLLDPESNGHWTIQEDVARALGEVELLSEESRFDFLALSDANRYWRDAVAVEVDQGNDAVYRVHNRSNTEIVGFTMVADGLVSAMVDGQRIEQEVRTIGGGTEQTWFWWNLPADGLSELRIEKPGTPLAVPVQWNPAAE